MVQDEGDHQRSQTLAPIAPYDSDSARTLVVSLPRTGSSGHSRSAGIRSRGRGCRGTRQLRRTHRLGAVFLSYASEDAAAAERIADALGAASTEVWFDKSELRGGEAWDRKIRKKIHGCALFIRSSLPTYMRGLRGTSASNGSLRWTVRTRWHPTRPFCCQSSSTRRRRPTNGYRTDSERFSGRAYLTRKSRQHSSSEYDGYCRPNCPTFRPRWIMRRLLRRLPCPSPGDTLVHPGARKACCSG